MNWNNKIFDAGIRLSADDIASLFFKMTASEQEEIIIEILSSRQISTETFKKIQVWMNEVNVK